MLSASTEAPMQSQFGRQMNDGEAQGTMGNEMCRSEADAFPKQVTCDKSLVREEDIQNALRPYFQQLR
jgi:hypothetical protein